MREPVVPVPNSVERLLARRDAVGVEGDAHVVVGAGENGLAAVDDGARGRQHAARW